MTQANYTHIHVLLDRSGSMAGREEDVSGWYKTFVAEQKKVSGKCTFSLATFDSPNMRMQYDKVIAWADILNVPQDFKLEPRGGTPLLDAIGRSITELGGTLNFTPEALRPSKVIVIVQTDGGENSSVEYKLEQIKAMVTRQQKDYNWDFMFLGADIDAFADASKMGFATASVASYGNNTMGWKTLAVASANAVSRSRSFGGAVSYTTEEQEKMAETKTTP